MATLDVSEYHGCASHQPVLCAIGEGLVGTDIPGDASEGGILECGSGLYSTPLLNLIGAMVGVVSVAVETLPEWRDVVSAWYPSANVERSPTHDAPGYELRTLLLHVDGTVEQRKPFVEWGLRNADIITHHDMDDCARFGTCELMRSAPLYMEYAPPNRSFGGNRPGTIFGITGIAFTRPEYYPNVIESLRRLGCK